jgi:hypothetical protein
VGAKSIFSANSIFSASFNGILKHLEFNKEVIFLLVLIQSILNSKQKQKKQNKFLVLKIRFEKISPFFGHFFGDCDNISDRQFLGDLLSYSKRVILLLPLLQVHMGF